VLLDDHRPVYAHAYTAAPPTSLARPDLIALARSVAEQVRAGAHEVMIGPERRWSRRLHAEPVVGVWRISWGAGSSPSYATTRARSMR
jgi:hypothetical protein